MEYVFEVIGEQVGKQRPKFSTYGGFVKTYTPAKTANYENLVKLSFINKYSDFKTIEKGKPIRVVITIVKQIPSSISQKKAKLMINGEILPTTKPDLDNICKSICDALNGIAYYDDNQIVELNIKKVYGDTPKAIIYISEIENDF